jgi:hypothetical protein
MAFHIALRQAHGCHLLRLLLNLAQVGGHLTAMTCCLSFPSPAAGARSRMCHGLCLAAVLPKAQPG